VYADAPNASAAVRAIIREVDQMPRQLKSHFQLDCRLQLDCQILHVVVCAGGLALKVIRNQDGQIPLLGMGYLLVTRALLLAKVVHLPHVGELELLGSLNAVGEENFKALRLCKAIFTEMLGFVFDRTELSRLYILWAI
jgi:hypothetical protein